MKKYVARQVPPEDQDADLFFITRNNEWCWEDDYFSDISVLPRSGYYHILTDDVEKAINTEEALEGVRSFTSDDAELLCSILQETTGKKYIYGCMHGCCQSDWRYIVYPDGVYTKRDIEYFEAALFNTGSEWSITEDSAEVEDCFPVYCMEYSDERIKEEIAERIGCRPEEIEMYKFSGYTRIPNYEKV